MRKIKEVDKFTMEEKLNQDFISEFVELRHKLGLTQQQMADKSNVLRDKIAKIEAGIYPPNITSLFKILGPLGYTIKIEKIKYEKNEWNRRIYRKVIIALGQTYFAIQTRKQELSELEYNVRRFTNTK